MGDKPTTLLARKIVPHPYTPALARLRLKNGHLTQNPELILKEFTNFYSKLYSQPAKVNQGTIDDFFSSLSLPKLTREHSDLMNREFSDIEIGQAIKSLNPSKAPGPTGSQGNTTENFKRS